MGIAGYNILHEIGNAIDIPHRVFQTAHSFPSITIRTPAKLTQSFKGVFSFDPALIEVLIFA